MEKVSIHELAEANKPIDLTEVFEPSQSVMAQHDLYAAFKSIPKYSKVPKLIFYIRLEETYGSANRKDSRGDLGYGLKLKK